VEGWEVRTDPITYEELKLTFDQIASMPARPHVHLVSAPKAEELKLPGGQAWCVGCGQLLTHEDLYIPH
jgi:hypothetical protein